MGKKKLSLKPVQRGFATTSVPTKKSKDQDISIEEKLGSLTLPDGPLVEESIPAISQTSSKTDAADLKPVDLARSDWDDEQAIDTAFYQGLVDILQEKAEKEISRVIKAIDFERRLAQSFPQLQIDGRLRDMAISLALQEEAESNPVRYQPVSSSSTEKDKTLLRTFVTYHVLKHLGFSEARICQCLEEIIGDSCGWEQGLEWMWLHLTEDECLQRGEFAKPDVTMNTQSYDPLVDVTPIDSPDAESSDPAATDIPTAISEPLASEGSLFHSLGSSDLDSDSDSSPDLDLNKFNETWAKLMLELDSLKASAGAAVKGKVRKNKGNHIVMETPEMSKLKSKISKVEKEYMFNRKEADVIFKAMKGTRDVSQLEARFKGSPDFNNDTREAQIMTPAIDTAPSASGTTSGNASDVDDDGSLFGNILEGVVNDHGSIAAASNTSISVRSMPIPKQFSFTGTTPKALLRLAIGKTSKQAVISYVRLSNYGRIARAGLEIRWSRDRHRIWRMDDIACESSEEAENYISTIALNDLLAAGDINGIHWRTMPPAYRDLWDDLEVARKIRQDEEKRDYWRKIKQLVDQKQQISSTSNPYATKTTALNVQNTINTIPPQKFDVTISADLQSAYERRKASSAYQKMRKDRDSLPIAPFRNKIIEALDTSQVLVFSGETGCGKSTQLPSFLLEDQLSKGRPCKILVTEPRRISAISLAQRVSAELGDVAGSMGTTSSLVGYSIRLESKTSANTRLTFVTNGIALRMLESGSGSSSKSTAFDEITHIIVDEVHERSIESDFLLIVLKALLEERKDIKVILMSATLDAEKLSNFFGGCPYMSVPGRTFPVNVNYLEDAVELTDWHIDESSPYAVWNRHVKSSAKKLEWTEDSPENDSADEDEKPSDPTKLSAARYSSRTVSTVNLLDSRQIPYHLIVRLIERICFEDADMKRFAAAILVFMPGLAEIRKLHDILQTHPRFGSHEFVVYPLHSTISSEGQSAVFAIPPTGTRKIVISTNIAETGVTIPDITCVIDSGKHREMRYDEKRHLSRLVEAYIARSNAKQRRGRAGRVQEGIAFHLFTKARHDTQLADHPIPEILRLSLQDLALRIKILNVNIGNSIEDVLLRALDPPSSINIQRAIASLVEVKALTTNEEITPMGRLLSKLPMDVHLGKFLLVAVLFKCLDPALTIAATLNSKSPFVSPFGFENQADTAKKGFAVGNSDFLTISNVFNSWRKASDNINFVKTFCKRNFVSHQNLQQIEELRQQLLSYLIDSSIIDATRSQKQEIAQARYSRGFRTKFVTVPADLNVNATDFGIINAALALGLYPKIVALEATGGLRTIANQKLVHIHPSSINFRLPMEEFGTNYLVYFTLMQSKKLYAWETGPVDDRALALLCGDVAEVKLSASSFQVDKKLRFGIEPKSALALKLIRQNFAGALATSLRGRALSETQTQWFELGLQCISAGQCENQCTDGEGDGNRQ